MDAMKPVIFLPLALLAVSCYPYQGAPFFPQRQPDQSREPYYPYSSGGNRSAPDRSTPGTETGRFEPIPPSGQPSANRPPATPPSSAPQQPDAPRISPNSPPVPNAAPTPSSYPEARPTQNPNQVISPYAPYNVIDVEGFKSGSLARDPSNQQIFRVP